MQIFNWKDVERISNVSKHRIKYSIQRGRLGDFTRINGAFVFSEEDVARIQKHFAGLKPWQRIMNNEINTKSKEVE